MPASHTLLNLTPQEHRYVMHKVRAYRAKCQSPLHGEESTNLCRGEDSVCGEDRYRCGSIPQSSQDGKELLGGQ